MIIEAKGLTKKFGQSAAEIVAVNQVDISIKMGELVMIMGDSGCGKTTLISLLGCILTPDEGELRINQKLVDYENDDLSLIRRRDVGFVFQLFNLIPYLTALENVMLAMDISNTRGFEAEKRAKNLLTRVGLEHRLSHRPGQLSGGEKQRVSFARALANQPKIIFADEPTANLDSRQSQNLMELVRELRQDGQTTIAIVTHYQELRKNADRVIHMKDGKII
ncbi:TPA: ABC transporter ATP-binding protein [Candidatus Poribacteria bacterium]|jgi:putative ABC transport system ATP-binding protein|nr:ABC transporter ATP-binding protein [Candidatus Poribacteria bacterium]HIB92096.1 ABC transporter ATP-binding protein [Candidatus Poribacteria bacterium]HIC01553.1 ABC transporter ATP-binding protein [Candidatus Poribacteria bacterium]HIM09191.1 ABC transporter ATP-binding protein [Candidatus Poribacteria bacterium]HIN30021.1 ABC transporter ATP-binding protein [Candidatus Poribacteria bacterium]